MFYYDQNEDISENMNEASVLSSEFDAFYDPFKLLSNIRQKNSNRLIIAQLNINSIRNKIRARQALFQYYF